MSDKAIREAAERLRRQYPFGSEHFLAVYGRGGAGGQMDLERDLGECAMAYVREHPADDSEPADIQWLNGLSREGGDMSFLCVRLCDDKFHLMAPGKVTEGINGLLDYVSPRPATRGDVRRLCAALGITLKEANLAPCP